MECTSTGFLPSELGLFDGIFEFWAFGKQLTGSVPLPAIWNASILFQLRRSQNKLTGSSDLIFCRLDESYLDLLRRLCRGIS
jgi:hypothetical protein